jgi:hypothetical protein
VFRPVPKATLLITQFLSAAHVRLIALPALRIQLSTLPALQACIYQIKNVQTVQRLAQVALHLNPANPVQLAIIKIMLVAV